MKSVHEAPLGDVIVTSRLFSRAPREPDYKSESEAFQRLLASVVSGPKATFDTLASAALTLCRAGSAGVSLVTDDERGTPAFLLVAVAGEFASQAGRNIPRDLSASSVCLDRDAPLLLDRPGRHFPYVDSTPPISESLIVPIKAGDRSLGTLWVALHNADHSLDAEDVRLLEGLARVAATAALQQRAIDGAEQEAMRRDELVAMGSHEVRNPLTTVIGFSSRLTRRDDLPEDAQEEIRLIAREASRLRKILGDFLDLSRLASASSIFEFEEVDLVELVHEQVAGFRLRHPATMINEEFEAAPFVYSDASRIAQIVTNLLENAAKYGGETPTITVRLRADHSAHIDVEDKGPGIPPDEQERIFDRAYRLRQRDGTDREGLGLGLYISRELAQRLGGSLKVDSEHGQGSTFTLTLPFGR